MIKYSKRGPIPSELCKQKIKDHLKTIQKLVSKGKLSSSDFQRYWSDKKLRKALWKAQKKKCCYTERHRHWQLEMDVEHYRPKAGVTQDDTHPGYWWLAYDWDNYLLSEKRINSIFKGNHFPLLRDGRRAFNRRQSLRAELPKILNPFDDDPEQFIKYEINELGKDEEGNTEIWVFARGKDAEGRGKSTIEILGLNEYEIVQERGELVNGLAAIVSEMQSTATPTESKDVARKIAHETKSNNAFAGFRRWYFHQSGFGTHVSSS